MIVPVEVWREALAHWPGLRVGDLPGMRVEPAKCGVSLQLGVMADTLDLAAGEVAALALATSLKAAVFLTDDAAARLAGESLGLCVHGTIGVVVRAIRMGWRSQDEVLRILRSLPERSTLHIARTLLAEVIDQVKRG